MMDSAQISRQHNVEIALLVLLLRVKMGNAKVEDLNLFIAKKNPNLDFVLKIISEHELRNIIFSSGELRELFFVKQQENTVLKYIELRARNNLLILAEILQLNKKINEKSIPVIFYKGVLLCKYLFNDFTTRATSDIDILIHFSNFLKIRCLLLDDGYEEIYYYPMEYPEYFLSHSRESSFKKKIGEGNYIFVELQWASLPKFFKLPYNNDYFFNHEQKFKFFDSNLPTLKITQHLLILFIHHGISDLWRNLKHVFDISIFIDRYNSEIDWNEFYGKCKDWHAIENFNCGLNLAKDLFGISPIQFAPWNLPKDQSEIVLKSLCSTPLLTKNKKSINNFRRQLLLCDTPKQKILLFISYLNLGLWPSLIDLENHRFPPLFFPLYFITKRFRFLYKRK